MDSQKDTKLALVHGRKCSDEVFTSSRKIAVPLKILARYFTSIVVTLNAGSVTVIDVPFTGVVDTSTG